MFVIKIIIDNFDILCRKQYYYPFKKVLHVIFIIGFSQFRNQIKCYFMKDVVCF